MSPIIKKWSHPLAGNDETPLSQLMQLAKAESGFYPIAKNGLLHGGVHFDKNTHPSLGSSAVRCIADGEVIAYRIDSEYPTTNYPQNQGACFSTGFVLVRHRLEPTVPDGTPPPPSLTLYSLYMHLQSWAGYQANASQDRPAFWDEKTYRVATQDGNLLVRAEANSNGNELSSLPRGTRVRVAPGDGEYRKLLEIVDGPLSSTLRPDANGHMPGYVAARYLRPEKEPALIDDVHVPNTPIAIAAGELIGYPGLYENRTDTSAEPLLHLEVFSCDDVKDYLKEIRKWAYDNRHTTPKTLLKVYAGVSKLIPDRPSASTVPSHVPGKTVGVNLIIPQSYLDALPADYKIATGAQPNHITHWWRLDNLLVDTEGQSISGWLAEQNPMTTRHSPWEWHDFDHIEDTDLPKNSLAYLLNALRCLTDSELASYRGLIDQSDKGPVKSRLYEIIDTNRDGQITHGEIKAAIQKPWHAQSIAQLILRQQSEWFWDKEKWNSLDDLLLTRDPGWQFEKERIEKLSWWNKVSEKSALPTNATAWHFHPLIFNEFFKPKKKHPIINIENRSFELDFLYIYQGQNISNSEIREAAEELRCDPGLIYAISRQESAHSSFIELDGEKVPTILYERHQFRNHSNNPDYGISHPEIHGNAYARSSRNSDGIYIEARTQRQISINDTYGPKGRFQYDRLLRAYLLHEEAALKACSWGKFQIMGFNHIKAGFPTVKEFTRAMSLGEAEHLKAFLKFAKSNEKLIRGLREKNFEMIAEGHNGSAWRSINPEYAANIERFYNEYHSN